MAREYWHPRIKPSEWDIIHPPPEELASTDQEEEEEEQPPLLKRIQFEMWYWWENLKG